MTVQSESDWIARQIEFYEQSVKMYKEHLTWAREQAAFYRKQVQDAKAGLEQSQRQLDEVRSWKQNIQDVVKGENNE